MNKTLIALGVGIWGIMLILKIFLPGQLSGMNLNCDQISSTLFPLTIIEIVAFIITIYGIIKN
ncbi:MAG: hypothetical protein QXL17_00575 [Candidatus Thermoplasmatota archaeon]